MAARDVCGPRRPEEACVQERVPRSLSARASALGKPQRQPRWRRAAQQLPLLLFFVAGASTAATTQPLAGEAAWALLQRGEVARARAEAEALLPDGAACPRAAVVLAEALPTPAAKEHGGEVEVALPAPLARLLGSRESRGCALVGRAVLWRRAGRPDLAESDLLEARGLASERGDVDLDFVVSEQLGVTLIELGRATEALATVEPLLAEAERRDASLAVAHAHLTLGRALVRTRDAQRAAEHLTAARDAARRLDLPRWEGTAEIALSVLSRFRMDLEASLAQREAALAAFRRGHDLPGQARALHYIATIRVFKGELTAAMGQLLEALDLARRAGDAGEISGCLGDLAGVNYLLGDLERAQAQYEEAVRGTGDPLRQALWQIDLASILTHQDEHAAALARYRDALATLQAAGDHRNEAVALLSIGRSLVELGRVGEGRGELQRAIAVARRWDLPEHEAHALRFLGLALAAEGKLPAAADTLVQATALARRLGNYQILEASLVTAAQIARKRGHLAEAQRHAEEALRIVADVRRRSGGAAAVQSAVVAESYDTYGLAIDLLWLQHRRNPQAGHDGRAFALAQEAKARSLLDLLAEAEVDLRCRADPAYVNRERAILAEMAAFDARITATPDSALILSAQLANLRSELDLLEVNIRAADPRYAALRYPRPCDLPAVRETIGPDEALVEFALADSASYVWGVTDDEFVFAALPSRRVIDARVRELLPLLQDPNLTGDDSAWYHPAASALFETLLGPVRAVVEKRARLVIAPDGVLHYLPFEALLVRPPTIDEARSFARLPYLRDARVVSYVPSASVLHQLRGAATAAPATRVLLVGSPVDASHSQASVLLRAAGAVDLPPLAHAAAELAAIEAVVGARNTVVLEGPAASATRLREAAGRAPFASVHFAVHGLYNERRPQYSGLLLSPDPASGDDGLLSTSEVFGLDLTCGQVVLSACSTALGRDVTGEGLVGLTRGFLFAGARRVISSLWDVADASTTQLMGEFYRQQAQGRDAAAALTAAKRILGAGRQDGSLPAVDPHPHPFYWAGFVLNGAG